MKSCPTCNRTYSDETLSFCLNDGTILSATSKPIIDDREVETVVYHRPAKSLTKNSFAIVSIGVLTLLAIVGVIALIKNNFTPALETRKELKENKEVKEPYNPYKGIVDDLLPKSIGEFTFQKKILGEDHDDEERKEIGFVDAVNGLYEAKNGMQFNLIVANFNSSKEANDSFIKANKEENIPMGDKYKEGKNVGKRVARNNGVGWSNGSLVIMVWSENESLDKAAIESKLPF